MSGAHPDHYAKNKEPSRFIKSKMSLSKACVGSIGIDPLIPGMH